MVGAQTGAGIRVGGLARDRRMDKLLEQEGRKQESQRWRVAGRLGPGKEKKAPRFSPDTDTEVVCREKSGWRFKESRVLDSQSLGSESSIGEGNHQLVGNCLPWGVLFPQGHAAQRSGESKLS